MAKLRTYNTRRKVKALKKAGWHAVFKKTAARRRYIAALRVKQAQFARFIGSFDITEDGALSFGDDAVEITQRLVAEAKKAQV